MAADAISRRDIGRAGLALAAVAAFPTSSPAERFPPAGPRAVARVIVDNDFAGDPDGLTALAYQLLAPTTRTVLVTSSAVDAKLAAMAGLKPAGRTAELGSIMAREVVRLAHPSRGALVVPGSETFGVQPEQLTDAARAIVAEARKTDELPLFVTCGGPLTNIAAALRIDPSIAGRMTVVWIGGRADRRDGGEYNLSTDVAAAAQIVERSRVPFWQVPIEAYAPIIMSRAELMADLRPISRLTAWLYDRLVDLPNFVPPSGVKGLGDCALVPLTSVSGESGRYTVRPARRIRSDSSSGEDIADRPIRVYSEIDRRLTIADMLATLRLRQPR